MRNPVTAFIDWLTKEDVGSEKYICMNCGADTPDHDCG